MHIRTAEGRDIRSIILLMNELGYPDAFISEKFAYLLKHPDYYIVVAVEMSRATNAFSDCRPPYPSTSCWIM